MKKHISWLLIGGCLFTLFLACEKENDPQLIRITGYLGDSTIETKAAGEIESFEAYFKQNPGASQFMRLFAIQGNSENEDLSAKDYIQGANKGFIFGYKSNNEFDSSEKKDVLYWPGEKVPTAICAIYPSLTDDIIAESSSLVGEQDGTVDLLFGENKAAYPMSAPLPLLFSHLMTKIKIQLQSDSYTLDQLKATTVMFRNLKKGYTSSLKVGQTELQATGELGSIDGIAFKEIEGQVEGYLLIVPQEIVKGVHLFTLTNRSYTYDGILGQNIGDNNIRFAPNTEYIFTIQVNRTVIRLESIQIVPWKITKQDLGNATEEIE